MPIITLTLSWDDFNNGGWHIEVCGGHQSTDLSSFKFVRVESGPVRTDWTGFLIRKETTVWLGPQRWQLTPQQEPAFGRNSGARQEQPPMFQVAKILEALEIQGCKVVSSHSSSLGYNSTGINVWTLEQAIPLDNNGSTCGIVVMSVGLVIAGIMAIVSKRPKIFWSSYNSL